MKKCFKMTAIIMALVMLITILPCNFGYALSLREEQQEISQSEINVSDITDEDIVCELTEKREANVKYFQLVDGSEVAAIYDNNVHELDKNGKYIDIDNSMSVFSNDDNEKTWTKNKGNTKVSFSKVPKENKLLTIKTADGNIKWSLNDISTWARNGDYSAPNTEQGHAKMSTKSVSGVLEYKNIMPNVDLQYQLVGESIKENIILNNKSAVQEFSFTLDTGKMTAECIDNSIIIQQPKVMPKTSSKSH